MKGLPYEVKALIEKARESALLAVETYNRPTAKFRSGAYIVLMVIAWTSLFLAIFHRRGVKPFYRKKGSRRFEKVDGEYKRWELAECLRQFYKSDNSAIRKNLEFFIALRNRIEHSSLAKLDPEIFGECQAMLLNFENLLCSEFGDRYAIRGGLTFALQFSKISVRTETSADAGGKKKTFADVKRFIDQFRSSLSTDVQNDMAYSFRVYLVPKIGNHTASDAVAVEWIKYDPTKPEEMKQYDKVVSMIKTKQVPVSNLGLLKPTEVVHQVRSRLSQKFTLHVHTLCYKHFNVRPAKGAADPASCDTRYCQYDTLHDDYGYTAAWVEFLVEKLSDEGTYRFVTAKMKVASGDGTTSTPSVGGTSAA